MQGEGGYNPAPARIFEELRAIADEHGILLVFDEVQTGFGRTAIWFASVIYGVDPDILVMGKGIAYGLPLSSYGASAELINQWPVGAHGTTFGGNPVACAAAAKVIDVMEPLLPHARDLSKRAFELLNDVKSRHRTIGDVRGTGLMIGVELVSDRDSRTPDPEAMKFISSYGLAHELIVIACGPDGNIIRFIPPLTTTEAELETAIGVIDDALTEYEKA